MHRTRERVVTLNGSKMRDVEPGFFTDLAAARLDGRLIVLDSTTRKDVVRLGAAPPVHQKDLLAAEQNRARSHSLSGHRGCVSRP